MSKLGESKLGSTQFAKPSTLDIDSEIDEEVRARAEAVFKAVYPTHEGTNWDKVLKLILDEFKREHQIIRSIIEGRFIRTATGEQLDMIGEMWQVERRRLEGDDHLRSRIQAAFSRHTSRATIDEMLDVSETILNTSKSRVHLHENFDIEPARFDLEIEEIVFTDAEVQVADYEEMIDHVRPVGVGVSATVGDQFTYRSVADFEGDVNNEDKGYDDLDPDTLDYSDPDDPKMDESTQRLGIGGPYADEITAQF